MIYLNINPIWSGIHLLIYLLTRKWISMSPKMLNFKGPARSAVQSSHKLPYSKGAIVDLSNLRNYLDEKFLTLEII